MTQPASTVGGTSADQDSSGSGVTLAPEPYELGDVAGPLEVAEWRGTT
jgi:hypothetical protein